MSKTTRLTLHPQKVEEVPCKWCGRQTTMTGTGMCDAHWELQTRIERDPMIAARMLREHLNSLKPHYNRALDRFHARGGVGPVPELSDYEETK